MPGSKVTADMKKEAFARIIFADPKTPKWLAAQEAGYKGNQNTLYSQASKLVNDPKVLAWLSRLAEEADAEAVVDYDRVVKDLAGLKIPTLPDYWKDGQLRDPETLSPVERAALKKWKVRRIRSRERGDEDWQVEEYIIEIELHDKIKILELLGKCRHVSAFTNVIQNQGTGEREAWLKKRQQRQDANRDLAGLKPLSEQDKVRKAERDKVQAQHRSGQQLYRKFLTTEPKSPKEDKLETIEYLKRVVKELRDNSPSKAYVPSKDIPLGGDTEGTGRVWKRD